MATLLRLLQNLLDWIATLRRPLTLDEQGELAAERYLQGRGYTIVARRERDRLGELDLVAVDHRTVVFVEVKTRRSDERGSPAEAVTPDKQRRIARAAVRFLRRHDLQEQKTRFDVVAVVWPSGAKQPTIEHFEAAFDAPLEV